MKKKNQNQKPHLAKSNQSQPRELAWRTVALQKRQTNLPRGRTGSGPPGCGTEEREPLCPVRGGEPGGSAAGAEAGRAAGSRRPRGRAARRHGLQREERGTRAGRGATALRSGRRVSGERPYRQLPRMLITASPWLQSETGEFGAGGRRKSEVSGGPGRGGEGYGPHPRTGNGERRVISGSLEDRGCHRFHHHHHRPCVKKKNEIKWK